VTGTYTERLPSHIREIVLESHCIAQNAELWPGWNPLKTPLVFHDSQVAYVIGHPAPPKDYDPIDSLGDLQVYRGRPHPDMAANTAAQVAGHWCALIMIPDPGARVKDYARLVLHECFHVYQSTALGHLPRPNVQVMSRYPENDPENNALSIIENRLLASGLDGNDAAVAEFLAVRYARHQKLRALGMQDVCIYEELSEYNEGTPTYVELKAGKPLADIKDGLLTSNVGGSGAGYRRFYFTGAAIALLLDKNLPGWQLRFAEVGKTLRELLQEALPESHPSLQAKTAVDQTDRKAVDDPISQVLTACGYREILDAERSREAERQTKIDSIMADLKSGPGVLVEIEIPPESVVLFDPVNILVVKPGVRIHTRMCGFKAGNGTEAFIESICLEDQKARRISLRLPALPEVHQGAGFTVSGPGLSVRAPAGAFEKTGPASYEIRIR